MKGLATELHSEIVGKFGIHRVGVGERDAGLQLSPLPGMNLPPPFPKLLPRLDKLLDRPRGWKRAAIDDCAFPMTPLIELSDRMLAKER
jgi:hypothetical protein